MSVTDEPRSEKQSRVKSPPQPIDEDDKKLWSKTWFRGLIAIILVGFTVFMLARSDSSQVGSAEDIATVYDHAIILQAREGDTLESAALTVFPNTLIEQRVREDKLSDEAKALELARYQAEWQRLSRLLTGTTGTTLTAGEFIAVPAKPDEPGAIEVSRVSTEIQQLTEEVQQATAGD
jgi:hypothetical protein